MCDDKFDCTLFMVFGTCNHCNDNNHCTKNDCDFDDVDFIG